ncbi:hypothetical protein AB0G74_04270 [Streptomyces sp. NPDC020875]|uniref:hypothetical protein n=1 Tax=Streptomyces sp. NPDC020875 TaxID=3154898 RepID=UPI0033C58283
MTDQPTTNTSTSTTSGCTHCRELIEGERAAKAAGDQSLAVDCRVLLQRHRDVEHHRPRPAED